MRIDLPCCGFKNCRYCFDGNCTKPSKLEKCEYWYLLYEEAEESEIIRCKDCKHWIPYDWMFSEVWQSKNMEDYPEDEIGCDCCDMAMRADDYCSRAERRGEEEC